MRKKILLFQLRRCIPGKVVFVELKVGKLRDQSTSLIKKKIKMSIIRYSFCYASVHRWNRILSGSMSLKSSNVRQMFLLLLFALCYFILWYTFDASFRCFISIFCIYPNFGHFLSLNISWNVADDLFCRVFFFCAHKILPKIIWEKVFFLGFKSVKNQFVIL